VVAKDIGRELGQHEDVHHINDDFTDDRLENLQLVLAVTHDIYHAKLKAMAQRSVKEQR